MSSLQEALADKLEDADEAEEDGRFEQAIILCNEVTRIDRKKAEAWKIRTRSFIAMERLDLALENAREAAKLFPNSVTHRIMQARIHVLARRWEKGATIYRAILRDNPGHLNSIRELMDFETITPQDDIYTQLVRAADDEGMKPYDRASTWFLRAQIHMVVGEDDLAFRLFDEGNRRMREDVHENRRLEYSFSRLLPELDSAFQRRHAPMTPPDPCPLFVISGLPRSGKTLLEKLLGSQSGLYAVGETSVLYNFFLDVDRSGGSDGTMRALRALPGQPIRDHFADRLKYGPKKGASRCIDTTPGSLEQLGLLGPLHPDVPIVFVRRDTRDLAASLYFKQFNKAHRYTYDLGTAARAIARTEYLARRWQATMPNPMTEIRYEEMVADPIGTARRILTQFGLPVEEDALRRAAGDDGRSLNLLPGRSLDGVGAIRPDLVGFSQRFARQLEPVLPAYEAEVRDLG